MQRRLGSLFLSTFIIFTAIFSFFVVFPLSVISGIVGASLSVFYGKKASLNIRRRIREDSGATGAQDADEEDLERPLTVSEIFQFFENSHFFRHFFRSLGIADDEDPSHRVDEIVDGEEIVEVHEVHESGEEERVIEVVQEIHENQENVGNQESQEIQQIQENPESQMIQEIPESRESPEVQENSENQVIQENQQIQENSDSQENQEIPEIQGNPEIQENREGQLIRESSANQEVPEIQENHETRDVQESQQIQQLPEIPQMQENSENQQIQENRELQENIEQVIQEHQEIPKIQESPETPEIQVIQENQTTQENHQLQANQEIQVVQENQKVAEVQQIQETAESQAIQEIMVKWYNHVIIPQNPETSGTMEIPQAEEILKNYQNHVIQENQEVQETQQIPKIPENQENAESSNVSAESVENIAENQEAISENPEAPSKAQEIEIPKNSADNGDSASGIQKTHSDSDLDDETNDVTHEEHQETFRRIMEMLHKRETTVKPNNVPLEINPNFFEPIDTDVPIVERAITPENPVYIQNYLGTSDCSSEGKEIAEQLDHSTEHSAESSKVFDNSVYVVNFNEENESLSKVMDITQNTEESLLAPEETENPSGLGEKLKTPSDMLQFAFVSTENLGNLVETDEKPAESDKKANVIGVEQTLTDFLGTALEIAKPSENRFENADVALKIQGNTPIFEQNVETPVDAENIVEHPAIPEDSLENVPEVKKATENPKPVPNPAETVDIPVKINEISSENKRIVENFLKNGHSPSKIMEIRLENEEKPLHLQMQEATQQLDQVLADVSRIPEHVEEWIDRIENPTEASPFSVKVFRREIPITSSSGEVQIPPEIAELLEHARKLVEQQENEPKLVELPSLSPEIRRNLETTKQLRDTIMRQVDRINHSFKGMEEWCDQVETIEVPSENRENSTENAENPTEAVVIPLEIEENSSENAENRAEPIEIPSENAENSENQAEIVIPSENNENSSENAENQENIQNFTEKPQKSAGSLSILTPTKQVFEKSQIPAQSPPGTPTKKASRFDEIVEQSSRNSSPRKMESNGASARTAQRHFQTLQIPTEILTTNANLLKTPENLENFAQKIVDYSAKTSKSMCLVTIRDLATLTDLPISAETVARITLKKKKVKVMKLAKSDELVGQLASILVKVLENSGGAATWIHFLKANEEMTSEQIAELYHSELKKIAREFYGESSKFAGNLSGINSEFLALSKDGYIWFNAGKIEF